MSLKTKLEWSTSVYVFHAESAQSVIIITYDFIVFSMAAKHAFAEVGIMSPPYQHHACSFKDKGCGSEQFGHAMSVRHPCMLKSVNNEDIDKLLDVCFNICSLTYFPFVWTSVKMACLMSAACFTFSFRSKLMYE